MRVLAIGLYLIFGLPGQTETPVDQAERAFRSGNIEQAQTLARQVVAKDPGSAQAHMILGVIAAQQQQWDAANLHFGAVVRLAPSNPHGYFYLGQANIYQKNWTRAVYYLTRALERNYPDHERLIVELAFAENEAGRPKQALATLEKVRLPVQGPLGAQFHAVTAFVQERLYQPAAAIDAIRRAIDLDNSNPQYREFLISSLISSDQVNIAMEEAIHAQRKFPDHPDIQFLLGVASYYITESHFTKLALRNLREVEPDGARVLLVEGMLYRKQGQTQDATKAFTEAAKRDVPDAHLLLGILLKEAGDYTGAEREYRTAERLNPRNGQLLLELGKLLLTRGSVNEALPRLLKAVQYMPTNSAVHYQLGLAYARLGQKTKAEHHLKISRQP
jgi:Flp pilus assembly protein TadD